MQNDPFQSVTLLYTYTGILFNWITITNTFMCIQHFNIKVHQDEANLNDFLYCWEHKCIIMHHILYIYII